MFQSARTVLQKIIIADPHAPRTPSNSLLQLLQPNVELLAQIAISVMHLLGYEKTEILSVHLVLVQLEPIARPERRKTQFLNLQLVGNAFEILGFS